MLALLLRSILHSTQDNQVMHFFSYIAWNTPDNIPPTEILGFFHLAAFSHTHSLSILSWIQLGQG